MNAKLSNYLFTITINASISFSVSYAITLFNWLFGEGLNSPYTTTVFVSLISQTILLGLLIFGIIHGLYALYLFYIWRTRS